MPPLRRTPLEKCPGFSCEGGLGKCLPIEARCNRIVDCLNGEDEVNCSHYPIYKQIENDIEFILSTPSINNSMTSSEIVITGKFSTICYSNLFCHNNFNSNKSALYSRFNFNNALLLLFSMLTAFVCKLFLEFTMSYDTIDNATEESVFTQQESDDSESEDDDNSTSTTSTIAYAETVSPLIAKTFPTIFTCTRYFSFN